MNALLWRASVRTLRQHPWQLGLGVLGIALGIGVICAVQLVQQSARLALVHAQQGLEASATHRIEALDGWLDDDTYAVVRRTVPGVPALPILRTTVELASRPGGALTLLGTDTLALGTALLPPGEDNLVLVRLAGTGVVSPATAHRLGLAPGMTLALAAAGRSFEVRIVSTQAAALPVDLLLVDIATAQELLARSGKLDAIELKLPDDTAALARLRAALPGARVSAIETRIEANARLTRSFDLNLTALSLLALLVGMFLVYNTETFLLLQRMPVLARLRALGVGRGELGQLLVLEAAALGTVGSLAGLGIGLAVAHGLLHLVARTVNDLYTKTAITEVAMPPALLLGLLAGGIATTVLAALPSILETVRHAVGTQLRDSPATRHPQWLPVVLAAGATLLAAVCLWFPTRSPLPGFVAVFCTLLAAAALLPAVLDLGARVLHRAIPATRHPAIGLGFSMLAANRRHHGLAAAALMVATATAMAMSIMITSFRSTVTEWLAQLLRADFYVALADDRRPGALDSLRATLAALPGVTTTSTVSRLRVPLGNDDVPVLVYDLPPAARAGFQFLRGDPAAFWASWTSSDEVLITEAFAWHQGLDVGNHVTLQLPRGHATFHIAGIYRDYASEHGNLAVSHATWLRHAAAPPLSGIGVYAAPGTPVSELRPRLALALAGTRHLLQAREEVVARSLVIFDRTFAITRLLQGIALGVAALGVASALLARQLEHTRDYAVLRALGYSRPELIRVALSQTLAIAVVAATAALPVAVLLGFLLVDVTNLRSFGWRMPLQLPAPALIVAWASGLGAALLAGVYPAWRASALGPAGALRHE